MGFRNAQACCGGDARGYPVETVMDCGLVVDWSNRQSFSCYLKEYEHSIMQDAEGYYTS